MLTHRMRKDCFAVSNPINLRNLWIRFYMIITYDIKYV